ncbi:N-acetyltransferase [Geomonas silvestris]|uniref:N-acetyltransferase n=1 Tax=Geomonas silvestris TaxID=2740184 RepID=A0A6V8MJ01_9BACT|nr:GNAT family N-acetyltransferase [Geomonas silvestris]GFO59950.1 N-acetyltransferase [Geomonas silvestris]
MSGCGAFLHDDIDPFLALATGEGWISGRWEFEFLLGTFPQGCLVWREAGETVGYLTSVKYGKSGWIGNLLVQPQARRHGIGRALMERAVAVLLKNGVETIWLTASEEGAGIYCRLGFAPIDHIYRWTGQGAPQPGDRSEPVDLEHLRAVDRVGWGDRRETLLQLTCCRGRLHASSGGFICCQDWGDALQVGPWNCVIASQALQLWDRMLVPGDRKIFLDVPAGNFAAREILSSRGFSVKGSAQLMYLGHHPLYQPGNIFALASMGSMG